MKENVRSIIKTGAILLVIGFVCTLLLSLCNNMTKERIAFLAANAEQEAMTSTLPIADKFIKLQYDGDGVVTAVYEGKNAEKEVVGYCVKAEPIGYGGAISMIVGMDTEGKVTGVDIVSMSETPGLGAKANEPQFTNGFIGKVAGVKVRKSGTPANDEISAISGATVTSKAVTSGVNAAIAAVESLQ